MNAELNLPDHPLSGAEEYLDYIARKITGETVDNTIIVDDPDFEDLLVENSELEDINEPLTRVEQYLYYWANNGVDCELPDEPLTRIELYLHYILTHLNGSAASNTQPDHIKIDTPPIKTEYEDGDTIDFTGIVVKIYNQDNTLWTSKKYPDGIAPFNELEFPVTVATLPEEGD